MTFIDSLFESTGWSYLTEGPEELVPQNQMPEEKRQLLESFKDFATNEAKKDKVIFPGGEVVVRPKTTLYKDRESLFHAWEKRFETKSFVHELQQDKVRVLFLGDFVKNSEMKSCFEGEVRDLLLKMIKAMKLTENEFSLSLMLKFFPEKESLAPKLAKEHLEAIKEEIAFLKPEIVITMGAMATATLLGVQERLSSIHGQFFERSVELSTNDVHTYKVLPIFHPEFLLINPNTKKTVWLDLQKAMKELGISLT